MRHKSFFVTKDIEKEETCIYIVTKDIEKEETCIYITVQLYTKLELEFSNNE